RGPDGADIPTMASMLEERDPRPRSKMTPRVRRDVLVDKTMLRLVAGRAGGEADPDLLARGDADVVRSLPLFAERGWVDEPGRYHRTPPLPDGVRRRDARSGSLRFESLSWLDGYEVRPEEPGADRYG